MTADSVRLRGGWPPLVAAALTLATDVVYVLVIQSQGEGDLDRTRARLIAASLAAAASAALAGWLVQDARIRLALLGAAAFTMLAWGFLGMFTIGLPIFLAGVLLLFSSARAAAEVPDLEAFAITAAAGISALVLAGTIVATTS
jgi:hypothetical protein